MNEPTTNESAAEIARRTRDPDHCWHCGAEMPPQREPVSVSGTYAGRTYTARVTPGPRLHDVCCDRCAPEAEARHQQAERDHQAHVDAAARRLDENIRVKHGFRRVGALELTPSGARLVDGLSLTDEARRATADAYGIREPSAQHPLAAPAEMQEALRVALRAGDWPAVEAAAAAIDGCSISCGASGRAAPRLSWRHHVLANGPGGEPDAQ